MDSMMMLLKSAQGNLSASHSSASHDWTDEARAAAAAAVPPEKFFNGGRNGVFKFDVTLL